MSDTTKEVIEIRGMKFEVDLREAVKIEHYKVGDRIKVLKKKYNDEWVVYHGVIIGFDYFKNHPTIVIAYIETSYNEAELQILYFNESTDKEIEIVSARDDDKMAIDRNKILSIFDKQLTVKQREIEDIQDKKEYFLNNFGAYFSEVMEQEEVTG